MSAISKFTGNTILRESFCIPNYVGVFGRVFDPELLLFQETEKVGWL